MAAATKDAVLGAAVELARQAAVELAEQPGDVGEHLGHVVDGERLVSHRFACTARGYRGWVWTVTLARVARSRTATVCEAVLLPGDDAILAPEWLPWSDRLRPGDIGPGDVLPFRADDPRLEPGWTPTGDEELDSVAIEELALARARVLSADGRNEAANRWYAGPHGPTSAGSLASAAACGSCGFLVPLQGSLGTVFGVCTNAWSPDDGTVVSIDHGCGAHSETDAEPQPSEWPAPDHHLDEHDVEVVQLAPAAGAVAGVAEGADADASADDTTVDEAAVDEAVDDAAVEDPAAVDTATVEAADDAAAVGAPEVLPVESGDAVLGADTEPADVADAADEPAAGTDPLAGEHLAELGSEADPEPGDPADEPSTVEPPAVEAAPADETVAPSDAPAEPATETVEPSPEP
ncbi:DUF3027 domain-containing protein [Cellulomonas cellasea]|uniref:DUF3027 domain-containing protein n=1 Tax=Cellulomonas cellasea TaxID=43670 RepID=A0A7W4UIN3_9CELL|nr:DUF3027 domain-containing protein [Cellulomonas cellasea]MBB2924228.1 hypothetical protein [Cellulomonas cellasea]